MTSSDEKFRRFQATHGRNRWRCEQERACRDLNPGLRLRRPLCYPGYTTGPCNISCFGRYITDLIVAHEKKRFKWIVAHWRSTKSNGGDRLQKES